MKNKLIIILFFAIAPLFLRAQTDTPADVNQLLGLSLEDLMNIKVVTAWGYMQTTAEALSPKYKPPIIKTANHYR